MSDVHADLAERVVCDPRERAWTIVDGVEQHVLEAMADRTTALVRLHAGQALPKRSAGSIDVVVLDGALIESATYIHDAATAELRTATGCTLLVKHRVDVAPGERLAIDLANARFGPHGSRGVTITRLFASATGGCAMLRFEPGATIERHAHELGEETVILEGALRDEYGTYATGAWLRQPPGSIHAVASDAGCLIFVFADHLAKPARRLERGDVFERYRIDGVLHRGPRTDVYAATHPVVAHACAIKLMTAGMYRRDLAMQLSHEARLLSSIRSDHVPEVVDYGQIETKQNYLIMRRVDGTRVPDGPIDPYLAIEYAVQTCAALTAVHAVGAVHRDVKPRNLLVGPLANGDPHVTLVSFGIAVTRQMPVGVAGSAAHMSPEQFAGAHDLDGRADLWSLGVTLYQLLCGQLPFAAATVPEIANRVARDAHRPIGHAPAGLNDVIDRCLAKDRAGRFANAAELADALAAIA